MLSLAHPANFGSIYLGWLPELFSQPQNPKVCATSCSSSTKVDENNKQLYIWFFFMVLKVKTKRLDYKMESSDANINSFSLS